MKHTCGSITIIAPWRAQIGRVIDVEPTADLGELITNMRAASVLDAARTGHRLAGNSTVRIVPSADHSSCTPRVCRASRVDVLDEPAPYRPDVATWIVMVTPTACSRAEVTIP